MIAAGGSHDARRVSLFRQQQGVIAMTLATHHRTRGATIATLLAALALAGCAGMGGDSPSTLPVPDATAQTRAAQGADRRPVLTFTDGPGLRLQVRARRLYPGPYGPPIHSNEQSCGKRDW